jgi:hypothetical protein
MCASAINTTGAARSSDHRQREVAAAERALLVLAQHDLEAWHEPTQPAEQAKVSMPRI